MIIFLEIGIYINNSVNKIEPQFMYVYVCK